MSASIALAILLACSALTLGMSIKRIPEGQVYTLRRLGHSAPRLLRPGTHWIWPVIEQVTHRISLAGHILKTGTETGLPRGTIFWQVLEPERADAVIEQAEAMIHARYRQAAAKLAALPDGAACNAFLKRDLNAALGKHGILVTRVRLDADA